MIAGYLLLAVSVATAAWGQLPPAAGGLPHGSSQQSDAAVRYDAVGRAGRVATPPAGRAGDSVFVVHGTLAVGDVVEVTALDTGRTIIAEVAANGTMPPDRIALLSAAAARELHLGAEPLAPVRIRPTILSSQERSSLAAGGVAPHRLDAPPVLLTALRRRLNDLPRDPPILATHSVEPPRPSKASKPAAPVPRPAPPAPGVTGRWFVQVATLSDAARAKNLAATVRGVVHPAGRLYRVKAGPFTTRAQAERARTDAVRRGFADARILDPD